MQADRIDSKPSRRMPGPRPPLGVVLLVLVSYIPLLLTKPGKVGADTKTYLYLDPGRLLSRAPYMWDPNIGLGTVTHQNIGYLWPMGPYYFVLDALGVPDWVAQRLWMGSILVAAGLGVRWMLKELRWQGAGVTVASFAYALSPYVLDYVARISVILLPFAGLPWLIGLSARCLRRQDWRSPAVFALVTLTVGGVNATSLLLVMVGPLLWFVYATFGLRENTFPDALKAGLRISLLTAITSLWWIAGLYIQGTYGIPILRYTETYRTVAEAALASELLRGLGYWFFYGQDGLGAWTASSVTLVQNKASLALSYLLPGLGFIGALATRWSTRLYFAMLVAAGLVIGVGSHPWDDPSPYGSVFKAWSRSDMGLSFRSTPRAVPLTALGLAVFLGAGTAALRRARPALGRPIAGLLLVLICLNQLPLFRGQFVDRNLMRDESVPEYWKDVAAALGEGDRSTRVMAFPGIDFAAYRWGNTVDPILPGLTDREYVARELIPYGTPPAANLLNSLDQPFQAGRAYNSVFAPMSKLMGVGDILFRADLQYERYLTPRPRETWWQLLTAPGLGDPEKFGPQEPNEASDDLPVDDPRNFGIPLEISDPPPVSVFPVRDSEPILRTVDASEPVVMAGDGNGLVSLAASGGVGPARPYFYSASFADDRSALNALLDQDGAALVVTDSNRRQGRRWGSVRENDGYTERAGEAPVAEDRTDNRLEVFPGAGSDSMTVVEQRGEARIAASSYGNAVTYTPGDRAVNAMDGDESTAWRVAAFGKATGEFLDVRLDDAISTDRLILMQGQGGKNRWMTRVSLSFDGAEPISVELDESSRHSPGQTITFDERTFSHLRVTIEATDIGPQPTYRGISDVGIAELRLPGVEPVHEVVRPPIDLLRIAGTDSISHPLQFLFTRRATNQRDVLAADEEPAMARLITNPVSRDFRVFGKARIAVNRSDEQIDQVLGLSSDVLSSATSSGRMPGNIMSRARSAVDGDPSTAYMTPVNAPLQTLGFEYREKVELTGLNLDVLSGDKYSIPRRVTVLVDGKTLGAFEVSSTSEQTPIREQPVTRLHFDTGPLSGRGITVRIDEVQERRSKDWFSGLPTVLPVAVTSTNLPVVVSPGDSERFDSGCRSDLMTVEDKAVPVRVVGTFGDIRAGDSLRVEGCGGPLTLAEGDSLIRTAAGGTTGIDVDLLAMASGAGGGPGEDTIADPTPVESAPAGPRTTTERTGRLSHDVTVSDATSPYWLILGQSLSDGWRAVTSDGVDLGAPTLVNGFANGWRIDPAEHGQRVTIHLDWAPQRIVWFGLALSAIGLVVCLGLALWPRRKETEVGSDGPEGPNPVEPVMSNPIAPSDPARTRLGTRRSLGFAVGGFVLALFFGGLWVGLAVLGGTTLALVHRWGRATLRATVAVLYGAMAGFIIGKQVLRSYPIDFQWVAHFETTHAWAITATFLLVASIAIDALADPDA